MGGPNYYAVAVGRSPGVYRTWPECQKQVQGFNNAKFKKFATEQEALAFIAANKNTNGKHYRPWAVNSTISNEATASTSGTLLTEAKHGNKNQKRLLHATFGVPQRNQHFDDAYWTNAQIVYTDGACSKNGRSGASAGWGVFWGKDHANNLWGNVAGEATNNRGELEAVAQAIEQAKGLDIEKMIIRTDSQLLIQSMDNWIVSWKKNNWCKSDGQPAKNQDLLKRIDALFDEVNVKFEYVAGHAGIEGNEGADELARKGAAVDRTMRHDNGSGGAKAKFDKKKESPQNSGNIPKVEGKNKIKKRENRQK